MPILAGKPIRMRYILFLSALIFSVNIIAQNHFSKVRIYVADSQLEQLSQLGIAVDHGSRKQNVWLDTDLSQGQIQALEAYAFDYDILIEDVQTFYIERSNAPQVKSDRSDCGNSASGNFSPAVPTNFSLGSYAGFYTYQEYIEILDAMHTQYPNLITQKTAIDTFTTHEGRPIYWVRMSDNPNTNESENEVLYTALHHAREPASLSQLIFYMWYMLENYGTDPEVTYLLDNTELYFVPMINPDGYIENETNMPNGGGMHRKNKRNVGTTNPGVDLNRNYAYQWNVIGTSPNPNDDTYAGTHGFSETRDSSYQVFL